MAQTQNKDKMLELTTEQIEKKFGKGAIMKLGSNADTTLRLAAIPTGRFAARCGARHRRRSAWSHR